MGTLTLTLQDSPAMRNVLRYLRDSVTLEAADYHASDNRPANAAAWLDMSLACDAAIGSEGGSMRPEIPPPAYSFPAEEEPTWPKGRTLAELAAERQEIAEKLEKLLHIDQ